MSVPRPAPSAEISAPEIISLGCRLNLAESESIRALHAGRDVVIVNSCAVTNSAVSESRAAIRRAARRRPGAQIIVTGCAAQIDPAGFAAMPEVARVIGNTAKLDPAAWAAPDRVMVSDIMQVRETTPHLATSFDSHARAFVEVQNGCDHRCTFCIIPYGRGNSRSVPAGAVVDRITALVEAGYHEVVLTGVDLTSYGPDLPGAPTLAMLIERILAYVPALQRLRLSSLDSIEIDERLFALVTGEARIMPHLHLSLQAGDDMILKRMKRRHGPRRCRPHRRAAQDRPPRHRDRCRPDRRLSHRDRGDVCQHRRPDRRLQYRPRAHFSLIPRATAPRQRGCRKSPLTSASTVPRCCAIAPPAAAGSGSPGSSARGSRCSSNAPARRVMPPILPIFAGRSPVETGMIATMKIIASDDKGLLGGRRMSGASWHDKLIGGFKRTSDRLLGNLAGLSAARLDTATLDDIEEALIASDLGPATAAKIRARLADGAFERNMEELGIRLIVAEEIEKVLAKVAKPIEISAFPRPHVILVIGVNGSGKTTTIAKLAHLFTEQDYGVMLAAGDTFRAAAIGQLATWAERIGVPIVRGPEGGGRRRDRL